MSSVVISGDTSGAITVSAPAVAGTNTQTLVAATGTLAPLIAGTAQTASSTAVDFTSIPSWVKRITVMYSGVSTSGTSNWLLQLGDSGGFETTNYQSGSSYNGADDVSASGFLVIFGVTAAYLSSGSVVLTKVDGNTWTAFGGITNNVTATYVCAGTKTLSDTLTQVRITTVNGTDTFDAGTINILYE
jgi:hypothetical protein